MSDILSALIGFAAGGMIDPNRKRRSRILQEKPKRTPIERKVMATEEYLDRLNESLNGITFEEAISKYRLEEDMEYIFRDVFTAIDGSPRAYDKAIKLNRQMYVHSTDLLTSAPQSLEEIIKCLVSAKQDGIFPNHISIYWNMQYIHVNGEANRLNKMGLYRNDEIIVISRTLKKVEEYIRQHGTEIRYYLQPSNTIFDGDLSRYHKEQLGYQTFYPNRFEGEHPYYDREFDLMLEEAEKRRAERKKQ